MCHVVVIRTRKLDEEEEAKIPWTQIIKLMSKKHIYGYDDPMGMATRRGAPIRLSSLLTPSVTYVPDGAHARANWPAGIHLETMHLSLWLRSDVRSYICFDLRMSASP